jgi:hypothetical protein
MPPARLAACAVLGLRIAYGAALVAVPGRVTRRWLGPAAAEPPSVVGLRGLGAREVALHGAGLVAALRGAPVRPWLAVSAAGDFADIGATAAARRGLPDGSPLATLVVAGGSAALSAAVAIAVDA